MSRRRGGPSRKALRCASFIVFAVVLAASIGAAPAPALAGPPPNGTIGSLLQLDPASGRAAASFRADYWFVDPNLAKCTYTTVRISWDGKLAATVKVAALDPRNPSYCYATRDFGKAPTSVPGKHAVTAVACLVDRRGVTQCPAATLARATYTVNPTPTLKVAPGSGEATAPFVATYATGETACSFPEAQFFWDGDPVGGRVTLDPASCTAVLDAPDAPAPDDTGDHRLTAEACAGARCIPSTLAGATYTVRAPKPTAAPSPTPEPSASASPSPSPSLLPSPSASVEPSVEPSPTVIATASPEPTAPPTPTPIASVEVPAVTTPTDAPPAGGNDFVPDLATYVTGPEPGGIDPAVVATNLLLTLLIVFLFALTAEIFNSTMDAHRDEVHGWWTRLMGGPLGVLGRMTVPGPSAGRVFVVLLLLGFVYSALSPDFGLNSQTLVLFVSLVVALGFLTYFSEGSTTRLAHRRYRADASVRLYGTAIVVSILAVVISRLVTFQPGLVYGFIASAVIVTPVALARRDDATLVLVPAFGLLVVSVVAWLLLGPVRAAAASGDFAPGLAETILAMIVIGGLETLFVSMIPLRFMDGATVMGWNRLAWALAFGTVTFLWWQLLLNQDHAYVSAMEQTNVQVVLGTVVVFMLTTGGLWSYFRFRPARSDVAEVS